MSYTSDTRITDFGSYIDLSDSIGSPFCIPSFPDIFPGPPSQVPPTTATSPSICQNCFGHCQDNRGYCPNCCGHLFSTTTPRPQTLALPPTCQPNSEHDVADSLIMFNMLNVVDDVLREDHPTTDTMKQSVMASCGKCGIKQSKLTFCAEYRETLCSSCIVKHLPSSSSGGSSHVSGPHPNTSDTTSPKSLSTYSSRSSTASYFSDCSNSYEDSAPNTNDLEYCNIHTNEKALYFCRTCLSLICHSCISDVHQNHCHVMVNEAYTRCQPAMEEITSELPQKINRLNMSIEAAVRLRESILRKKSEAIQRVQQLFQSYKEALAQHEEQLMSRINELSDLRLKSLMKEKELKEKVLMNLKALQHNNMYADIDESKKASAVKSYHTIAQHIEDGSINQITNRPVEDDSFIVKPVNPEVQESLRSALCVVTTAPYPPLCTAMGEGLFHPRVNNLAKVLIVTKDKMGEPCIEGGERIAVSVESVNMPGSLLKLSLRDNQDGSYTVNFRPKIKGDHVLSILIRGHHIKGSPFKLEVDGGREYNNHYTVSTSMFGSDGSQPGQFCRPWGIASDQHGNIIIGDRSNHRIQVFNSNGVLKTVFGSEGSEEGQFNRPAGVATTREGHIVVADKDNHRIQIFQIDGKFIRGFGEKGGNDGQMIYPYDVAVNQVDGRIAITDTGNHRLQIFSHDGILLGKFGYKGYLCGHFDSPRGIAFNDEGHIIVSDFNVHHILVIHPDGTTARILGSQGIGNGQFMRPQGIAVDHLGNFVIADTRNSRIVIMHPSGHFIAKFGGPGSGQGQLDRPTSVCILPDGKIAVVDFGNSRVQIF